MEHLKKVARNKEFENGDEILVRYIVLFENTDEKKLPRKLRILIYYCYEHQIAQAEIMRLYELFQTICGKV